ncbi:hypothetical protein AAFP35_16300 [Gordonia sp. CPCC 206044]|uniref:hypothetical protein n=1 Tax=Gordonia sp. CPCC 206044 TaxID=3140793 RepID=UPI003AF3CCCD
MTRSSVTRTRLMRRVAAATGFTAALLVTGPVGPAFADDTAAPTANSSTEADQDAAAETSNDVGSSSEPVTPGDTHESGVPQTDAPDGPSTDAPAAPSTDVGAPESDVTDPGGAADGSTGAEQGATTPDAPGTPSVETPEGTEGSKDQPSEDDSLGETRESSDASTGGPERNDATREPSENSGDGPDRTDGVHTSSTVDVRSALVQHDLASSGAVILDVVRAVTTPLTEFLPAAPGADSVVYRLTHGSGKDGVIMLNQSLVVAGVLNRRGRDDGADHIGLLGSTERQQLRAQMIAEQVVDRVGFGQLIDAIIAPFVWRGIDPDNRYLDPSDFQVLIGDNYRIADADAITYTYDEDADTITFTNTGDTDVAVIAVDQYNVAHGQGIYVVPAGGSTTIDAAGAISGYVVQAERDAAGRAIIYGMVVVQDDSTLSYNFNPFGGAIRDADEPIADPDDAFWDPADGLATGMLWPTDAVGLDGGDDGVYYSTGADGVTVHNDSDHPIAITVMSGSTSSSLPQTDFYVVEPGGSRTIALAVGDYAVASVQGERITTGAHAGTAQLYGAFVAQGGPNGVVVTDYPVTVDGESSLPVHV